MERKVDMIEEKVVPGKLTVAVYAHELETHAGRLPVWTFVSKGLWTKGQREIRITVKQEAREAVADYPRDLLDLYQRIYGLVEQGRSFDVGDVTESERALLGRADFRFVLYTPAQVFDGAPSHAPSLTALIVTGHEADAAQRLGVLRVMTRLGEVERFYPTTPWADRARAEVIGADGNRGSVLESHAPQRLDARARLEGDRVVLTARESARDGLRAACRRASDGGVPWTLSFDPTADAYLAWAPGRRQPSAIARPGSKGAAIGLNFIVVSGSGEKDAGALVEDGYFIQLTPALWKQFLDAVDRGVPLRLRLTAGSFELAWTKVRLADPVTGGEYFAPGGFDIYRPAVPGPALMGPVAPGQIVLLTPQDVLLSRISTKALGAFLKEVEKEIVAEGGATPIEGGVDLVVDFVGDGGKNTFRLGFRPEMPRPFADRVQARLDKLPSAPVGHGEIHVQLYYRLHGGAGDSLAH